MRAAIITMVYNERINLPIWIRHYTAHCPGATLFAIDHGSDDGSTRDLSGIKLIPLPRTAFDDQVRVEVAGIRDASGWISSAGTNTASSVASSRSTARWPCCARGWCRWSPWHAWMGQCDMLTARGGSAILGRWRAA